MPLGRNPAARVAAIEPVPAPVNGWRTRRDEHRGRTALAEGGREQGHLVLRQGRSARVQASMRTGLLQRQLPEPGSR